MSGEKGAKGEERDGARDPTPLYSPSVWDDGVSVIGAENGVVKRLISFSFWDRGHGLEVLHMSSHLLGGTRRDVAALREGGSVPERRGRIVG